MSIEKLEDDPLPSMGDRPETFLDISRLQTKLTKSDFAHVIFHNVKDTYPPECHIDCTYTLTSALKPSNHDWVGLFKVGWGSPKDYFTYTWAPRPSSWEQGCNVDSSVHFNSYYLPKDESDYYQFVYVSNMGEVKGASTPFQFRKPEADDFIEIEDENSDMLMVQTRSAVAEEQLKAEKSRNNELEQRIRMWRKEYSEKDSKLNQSLSVQAEIKVKIEQLLEDIKKLQLSNEESIKEKEVLVVKVNELKEELQTQREAFTIDQEQVNERVHKADAEKIIISCERDDREKELKKVVEEKKNALEVSEMYKQQFTESECMCADLKKELDLKQEQVNSALEDAKTAREEAAKFKALADQERNKLDRLNSIKINDMEELKVSREKNKYLEDQVCAIEEVKKLFSKEKQEMALKFEDNKQKFEEVKRMQKQQMDEKDEIIMQLREESGHLKVSLRKMIKESEGRQQTGGDEPEQRGAMFALQTALDHLQGKHAQLQGQQEETQALNRQVKGKMEAQEERVKELEREAEDLRERLKMGAAEYKTKYRECYKLQQEIKKVMQQDQVERKLEEAITSEVKALEVSRTEEKPRQSGVKGQEEEQWETQLLQEQLQAMQRELEERAAKYKKYKHLLQEERENQELCAAQFNKQISDKNAELAALRLSLDDAEKHWRKYENAYTTLLQQMERHNVPIDNAELAICDQPQPSLSDLGAAAPRPPTLDPAVPDLQAGVACLYGNPYAEEAQALREDYQASLRKLTSKAQKPVRKPRPAGPYKSSPPPPPEVVPPPLTTSHQSLQLQPVPPPDHARLPPPLQPTVTAEAKVANVRSAAARPAPPDLCPPSPDRAMWAELEPEAGGRREGAPAVVGRAMAGQADVDRSGSPAEFHDAQEYHVEDPEEGRGGAPGSGQDVQPARGRECPFCGVVLPPLYSQAEYEAHVRSHSQERVCPICGEEFYEKVTQAAFEEHVNKHFPESN